MISVKKVHALALLSIILFAICGSGFEYLKHSPAFLVQSIGVIWVDSNESLSTTAIDEAEVKRRLQVPLGKVGLMDVDVRGAENRILSHDWVRAVKIKRHFPNSLEVMVGLRTPKAVLQFSRDTLRYVDQEGVVFGHPTLREIANLPVFSGFVVPAAEGGRGLIRSPEIREALYLIEHWDSSVLSKTSSISTVYFDPGRGFRMVVSYPFSMGVDGSIKANLKANLNSDKKNIKFIDNKFRTIIDLGQEIDGKIDQRIMMLSSVIKYLSEHSMPARQIWAEVDKKIVVKTVHGS